MNLKPLRIRLGITQRDLADRLGTTQQTIARWESGANSIPTKYLKDLAVFLGCPVSSLLGVDKSGLFKRPDAKGATGHEDDDMPYGAVRLTFNEESRTTTQSAAGDEPLNQYEWPISEAGRASLIDQLQARSGFGGEDGAKGWLNLATLDDRFILLNPSRLESIEFISDDVEATPHYEHGEIYEAINLILGFDDPSEETLDTETSTVSRQLIEKAKGVIEQWGGEAASQERMNALVIEKSNGHRSTLSLEEANVTDILFGLLTDPTSCADHRFGNLTSEGYHAATYFRYGSLRLIELSKSRWDELMDEQSDADLDDSAVDQSSSVLALKAKPQEAKIALVKPDAKKH